MTTKPIDMSGKRYHSLVAVKPVGKMMNGNIKWLFVCDCGEECEIDGYAVRTGKQISCSACGAERSKFASITHGMSESDEFKIWTDMNTRCYNENSTSYSNYGGRGIQLCERWKNSFEAFFADMGKRPSKGHSIDRKDVNGDYSPENCKWATAAEQAKNKRNNVLITIDGETRILSDWAKHFGVFTSTASLRYKRGYRGIDVFKSTVCMVSFNGIEDTIAGWSKRTGIKKTTIFARLKVHNWPVERALTEGAKK